jgi:hypothetical protein
MRLRCTGTGGEQMPDETDQGQWLVIHPREILTSFFLPLPEPLAFPQGRVSETLLRIGLRQLETLVSSALPFGLRRLDKDTPSSGGSETSESESSRVRYPVDLRAIRNWSNKALLSSSALSYHVITGPWSLSYQASALVQEVASEGRIDPSIQLSLLEHAPQVPVELIDMATEHGIGEATVVEVAVYLRLLGRIPPLPDLVPKTMEGPTDGFTPDVWPFVVSEDEDLSLEVLSERLQSALDVAIYDVRSIQRAYHAITRHPINLLTRERLPSHVPFTLRRLEDIGVPGRSTRGLLEANRNLWAVLRPPGLTDAQLAAMPSTRLRVDKGSFSAYLDLYREADASFRRHGDYRLAALLAGVASESLLDDLLMYLMWEEAMTPEEAADQWTEGLDGRVKRLYASRIGGSWDLSGSSPIAEWSKTVAELRNRVVHGAYVPSFAESSDALRAVRRLVSYLCDRLSSDRVVQLYPRTCLALAGWPGLERRGVEGRHIRDLLASPEEPPWDETFARWKEALQLIRRDRLGAPRSPSEVGAYLLAVLTPDGVLRWCLHDRRVSMAEAVAVRESDIPESTRRGLDGWVEEARAQQLVEPVSFALHNEALPTFTRTGQWVEEYHLVPMAGVMVDRSDFDH